jgi:hypothetical protein
VTLPTSKPDKRPDPTEDPRSWLHGGVTWRHWTTAIGIFAISVWILLAGLLFPGLGLYRLDGSFWGIFWLCSSIFLVLASAIMLQQVIFHSRSHSRKRRGD